MWQEAAIILIGILTVVYVVRKLFRLFNSSGEVSPCAGCAGHCPLKTRNEIRSATDGKKEGGWVNRCDWKKYNIG